MRQTPSRVDPVSPSTPESYPFGVDEPGLSEEELRVRVQLCLQYLAGGERHLSESEIRARVRARLRALQTTEGLP